MDFQLTEEQQQLRDMTRELAREEFAPQAAQWDQVPGSYPLDALAKLNELGYLGLAIPEEYGGVGAGAVASALVVEELSYVSAALAIMVAVHNTIGAGPNLKLGNEAQKKEFLPRLAAGELAAFSLSEPDAGSDVAALAATARRDGDDYILNGAKNWVTNGAHAKILILFAKTDPKAGARGISGFVVEAGTPGLEIGKPEDKLGLRGSDTVALALTDLRVPASRRLGDEGVGMKIALAALDSGRISVGAQSTGIAQAALDESTRYARERRTFGKPLAEHGAVQAMLAEMERRVVASRLMYLRASWLREQKRPFTREAAMAKLYGSEAVTFVTHRAIQVHGGYGFVKEYPVERYYRDARVCELYEGTSEIQRLVIARDMVKRSADAEAAAATAKGAKA